MLTELLTSLLLAGMMPWAFFWASCPCCPTGSQACSYCDGTGNNATTTIQVVLTGMANSACTGSNCPSLDGTYILNWTTAGISSNCRWFINTPTFPATVCTRSWTLNVYISATELKGVLVDSFSLLQIIWQSSASGFSDCLNWSSFDLPYSSSANTQCSGSGATFVVTKL